MDFDYYLLINKWNGDRHYAKYNLRADQGLANLTNAQAQELEDLDYYFSHFPSCNYCAALSTVVV